jgi:hypothetical protein
MRVSRARVHHRRPIVARHALEPSGARRITGAFEGCERDAWERTRPHLEEREECVAKVVKVTVVGEDLVVVPHKGEELHPQHRVPA